MTQSLKGYFLIAMPNMRDPNFSKSVTLICEHTTEGAMGVTFNIPSDLTLGNILGNMEIESADANVNSKIVLAGGPVAKDRGFILHRPSEKKYDSTCSIGANMHLTASKEILEDIAHNNFKNDYIVALGYAGWGAGQLENELAQNDWLCGPGEAEILFNTPVHLRWSRAATIMGIDINTISTDVGHA